MMDKRLVERIERARREVRILEGTASEEELRASVLDQQLKEFSDQVTASFDVAIYLLKIDFARDEEGPVARLTADGVGFELRQGDNNNLVLRETSSNRALLTIVAGEPQFVNRILCAIANSLAAAQ